uniref:O-antigen ligase family protein n=1 Tax=Prevotella sp. TaxID=59823 RepID=UPI0040255664
MRFLKNPCNVYISLLVFYNMQGTIIPTGGTVFSQLIILVAMLMGLYYTVKTIALPNKPIFFTGLNVLFLMFVIYGVALLFSDNHYIIRFTGAEVSNSSYLKSIFLSVPNIYAFYYFSRRGYLTEPALKKWVVVYMMAAVFIFFDYKATTIHKLLLEGTDVDEVTNNMGYLFVALIPAVAVFKNKNILQYGFLSFCMVFIVMGMKRGAIIVGVLSILYFLYFNYRYHRGISKLKVLFFSILIVLAAVYVVTYMMDTSEYFSQRILQTEEGGSSGRDVIYEFFWNHFKYETDTGKYLFGNGANATLGIGVNYAHNDWLEIAINQGLLGLVVYAFYWLSFYKTIRKTKQNLSAKLVLTLSFISFFTMTIFSMSYTEYSIFSTTVFGYYLARCREVECI